MAHSTHGNNPRKISGQRQHQDADPVSLALRQLWDAFEMEPVPEDFLKLLDDLDNLPARDEHGPEKEAM